MALTLHTLHFVLMRDSGDVLTQPYCRTNTGGWLPRGTPAYIPAATIHRVTVKESAVKDTTVVHVHGFTSWTFGTSRRRMRWRSSDPDRPTDGTSLVAFLLG